MLSKAFTIEKDAPATNGSDKTTTTEFGKLQEKYELGHGLTSVAVPITWSSKDHDLVAKKPAMDITQLEAYDDFDGQSGSFFNFFATTDDIFQLHDILLELHAKVLESVCLLLTSSCPAIL